MPRRPLPKGAELAPFPSPDFSQLPLTSALIPRVPQSNLRRQHMVTKQSTFAVYRACRDRGCADMVQMALVMYPLPMSVIHYLDAFV